MMNELEVKDTEELVDDCLYFDEDDGVLDYAQHFKDNTEERRKKWVSIESLINHIKDLPDANVKAELMSLLGGSE